MDNKNIYNLVIILQRRGSANYDEIKRALKNKLKSIELYFKKNEEVDYYFISFGSSG